MAIQKYKKGDSTKIAENFRAKEFDCQGSGCCSETPIDEKLVAYLQKIRSHFGKPLVLTAYRCPVHNARTPNAAPKSRHIYGQAADFHITGVAPAQLAAYAEEIGVKGIGLYETFVHIDTREKKSFWYGHGQQKRETFRLYSRQQFLQELESCGGPVTLSATKNRFHPAVLPVQKRLAALGYSQVGTADGIAGRKFTKAVKAFQKDNGCVSDGELTAGCRSWEKLQSIA